MDGTAPEFYDDLTSKYHLIFEDWDASIANQAAALAPIGCFCKRPGAARIAAGAGQFHFEDLGTEICEQLAAVFARYTVCEFENAQMAQRGHAVHLLPGRSGTIAQGASHAQGTC